MIFLWPLFRSEAMGTCVVPITRSKMGVRQIVQIQPCLVVDLQLGATRRTSEARSRGDVSCLAVRLPAEEAIRRRRRRPVWNQVHIFQDKILTAARGIRAQKLPRPDSTVCPRYVSYCHVLDTHNASHIWARVWVLRAWAIKLCYPDWDTRLDHMYIFICTKQRKPQHSASMR